MRSHLALVVVITLSSAACTQTLRSSQLPPCPAPGAKAPSNGIGIIGMSLDQHPGATGTPELFVDRVVPDGPAARAGVRPGDRIYRIQGTSTGGMSVAEAARQLRGPTGATVALQVGSSDRPRDVTITRVAPSDLWSHAASGPPAGGSGERVHASDVAPAAGGVVPPCRQ